MKVKKTTKLWQWQMKCKNGAEKCRKCGETRFLTVEHIVPVYILEMFLVGDKYELAYEMDSNFEILCKWCNKEKGGTIDLRHPKTFEVLEYVIKKAKDEINFK